jgi:regulatory protein
VSANRAYLDALRMLARRELSEAQIRQRLARREHEPDLIDEAVARLKEERAIDDVRVAEAIARTETSVRKRGRLRVIRKIESAGIGKSIAKQAVDAVYGALDAGALLEAALAKRLRGRDSINDQREFNRLYRYLIGQGFEPDRVLATLRRKKQNQT